MRDCRDVGEQRSAWMVVAFWGYFAFVGIGGVIMSVRITSYCGSWSRRSARRGPIMPAAPVMRIRGIFGMGGGEGVEVG